jgi:hypothetical protein
VEEVGGLQVPGQPQLRGETLSPSSIKRGKKK